MHNRLIFRYRRVRAKPNIGNVRGCLRTILTELVAGN